VTDGDEMREQCVREWQREFENGRTDDSSTGQLAARMEEPIADTDGRQLEINPLHSRIIRKSKCLRRPQPDQHRDGDFKFVLRW